MLQELILHATLTLAGAVQGQTKPTPLPTWNQVNLVDRGLRTDWSVEEGKHKNIKWVANLGNCSVGTPLFALGNVIVSTSNYPTRPPRAVLRAFRESDGKRVWEIEHDLNGLPQYPGGLVSSPVFDGAKIYYATPLNELICADAAKGVIYWRFDMKKELGVVPFSPAHSFSTAPAPSPLMVGDFIFAITGNGINEDGEVAAPKAPSFVAWHRQTGKVAWQSNLPGDRIIQGQWSPPIYADVGNDPQVIFNGGDGTIYSFEPTTGKLRWKCDCLPQRRPRNACGIDPFFAGPSVVARDRLYVAMGVNPNVASGPAWSYLLCLDTTKDGDVSFKSYDAENPANKSSALLWAYGGPSRSLAPGQRRAIFGRTFTSPTIHEEFIYIAEEYGYLHCVDATTGRRHWIHDLRADCWSAPACIDGKIYIGDRDGKVSIFKHGKQAERIAAIEMDDSITANVSASNNTLFVMTHSKLFAIK